jgi:hypothetical protein
MLKNTAKYYKIYCNLLQFTANTAKYYKILQNTTKYCNILYKYLKILQNTASISKVESKTRMEATRPNSREGLKNNKTQIKL